MRYLTLVVIGFVVLCGWMVVESGVFKCSGTNSGACTLLQSTTGNPNSPAANESPGQPPMIAADNSVTFSAVGGPVRSIILGSVDPKSGYNFRLELSSKGAAIRKATFSGFNDRDYKNPQPLEILSPIYEADGSEILSMATSNFGLFLDPKSTLLRPFQLEQLSWRSFDIIKDANESQTARFEAIIKIQETNEQLLKITKTYKVIPRSYLVEYNITVENLSRTEQKVRFNLSGPCGLGREGFRSDMRKVIAGFRNSQRQVVSVSQDKGSLIKAKKNLDRAKQNFAIAKNSGAEKEQVDRARAQLDKAIRDRKLTKPGTSFLWAAAVNKYFAAIIVPLPDEGKEYCDWVTDKTGSFYNPDGDTKADSGDETVGLDLKIASNTLAAGQAKCSKTYNFQFYLGPKDKSLFDKNQRYRELGFYHTIDFMGCCCPGRLIKPLAFGILAIMKWMYGFIGNYGVVIIILVFLMRLIMHPITKKSQVSMSKMSKLAPMAEEIKKKYANNKAEMNKQMMALYREQGASPIMGFLPMMVQMPIWIALWSAIYASIELRGARFLPFWITDLSIPDALWRFPAAIVIPLLGWKIESLNLLPIMMGVAFYLQQKLMPSQASAATNPQVAQQQKMMMIMMPLMFPLMLYKAPSGVNMYIMSSTFAGVVEQYVIRKHIREKEQAESKGLVAATKKTGGKVKKKKPKPFYRT
jgi:YidC/Oxa1 family membrane protein insertase